MTRINTQSVRKIFMICKHYQRTGNCTFNPCKFKHECNPGDCIGKACKLIHSSPPTNIQKRKQPTTQDNEQDVILFIKKLKDKRMESYVEDMTHLYLKAWTPHVVKKVPSYLVTILIESMARLSHGCKAPLPPLDHI
jgi:hypothetical protein